MSFRKNHLLQQKRVAFVFVMGGIGDYICYLSALNYVAEKYPFIDGILSCPDFFCEIASNALKKHENWSIFPNNTRIEGISPKDIVKIPQILPVNATMMHLLDLGFLYFAETNPVPNEYNHYLQLDLKKIKQHSATKSKKYAVMVPGSTALSRTMPPHIFNEIKNYILSLGLNIVLLGNNKIGSINGREYTKFNLDYNLNGCINLLNKTSLLEAAKIIDESEFIIGLDNGLLHLAAMTKAPIIFGYSVAGPGQRRPRRNLDSPILDVNLTTDELECVNCQQSIRFTQHDFKFCYYKDYKCLELNDSKKYIEKIDMVLG